MRLLALTEDALGPATRYRVLQFVPALEAAGIETQVVPVPEGRSERTAVFEHGGEADVVLLQRRLLTPWDAERLRARSRCLVFDFDDALPFRDSSRGAGRSLSRAAKFRAIVSRADLVIAGNPTLASIAEPEAKRVVVVPTAVPLARFDWPAARAADPGTLGWIGSRSTLRYLEEIVPALDALAASDPDLRLRVVSDAFPRTRRLPLEAVPWRAAEESQEIGRFDIGLAPLSDDAWARGKCALRVLLYFAARVPVVASPVGLQAALVEDGVTGVLARGPLEFGEAVQRLRADRDLARACAARARKLVEDRYSLDRVAPLLVDAIRSVG